MTAQVSRSGTSTLPGGSLKYSIWVWSNTKAREVSATIERGSSSILAPRFSSTCPSARGNTCSIGSIPPNQAIELIVTDPIAKTATVGQQLTVTVAVEAASMSPAEASFTTVVTQRGSSPAPIVTVPGVPTEPGLPGTTITPGGINSLFPTVTPSPTSSSAGRGGSRSPRKVSKVLTTASSLPIDPHLIGGQVVGLAVLGAAITMVVARLSLRTPQPSAPGGPAAAAAPPPAEPADKPEPGEKPEPEDSAPAE